MTNWRDETEERWCLRVAKAEAWDEGYYAAFNHYAPTANLREILSGVVKAENPYDRMDK